MKRSWLLVAALLLLGCKQPELAYHEVEFPGFSLEAPRSVKYTGAPTAEAYLVGTSDAGPEANFHMVKVSWRAGGVHEDLSRYSEALGVVSELNLRIDPPRAITVGTHKAVRVDARSEAGGTTTWVDIECGKRAIFLTMSATKHIGGMQQRVLDSFDCHPIAAHEAVVGTGIPIGFDDPALFDGWSRVPDDERFELVKDELVLVAMQSPMIEGDEATLVAQFAATLGGPGATWAAARTERRGSRTFHHGMTADQDGGIRFVITTWNCRGRSDSVIAALGRTRGADLSPYIKILEQLRCPQIDDPPLDLPVLTVDE